MGSVRHCFPSMDKIWLMSMEPSPSAGKGAPSGNISFIMAAISMMNQLDIMFTDQWAKEADNA